MQVDFYQLSDQPVEKVVVELARKVVESGGRLLIVSAKRALLDMLDERLWAFEPAAFLPHAKAGEGMDAMQPVLLADAIAEDENDRLIMIADGAWREESVCARRVFYLFDQETIDAARAAWRSLAERADVETNYWKRDGGRWVKGP